MRPLRVALAFAVLGLPAVSQVQSPALPAHSELVVPFDLPTTNAYRTQGGWDGATRDRGTRKPLIACQQIQESGLLKGREILRLSFRREARENTWNFGVSACSTELEVFLSNVQFPPHRADAYLSSNRGGDFGSYVSRAWFNWPAHPPIFSAPAPFTYHLPLNRPFKVVEDQWMFEIRVFDRRVIPNDWAAWEWAVGRDGDLPEEPIFGSSCGAGPPMLAAAFAFVGGTMVSAILPSVVAHFSTRHYFAVGHRRDRWLGLPLPIDLAPIGAPGCFLHIAPDFVAPGDPRTPELPWFNSQYTPRIPLDGALVGSKLYVQGFGFPFGHAGLSLYSTNASEVTLKPPGTSFVCAVVKSPPLPLGANYLTDVGGLVPDWSLVTLVRYR